MAADFSSERVDLAKEGDFQLGEILIRPSTRQVESGGSSETLEPRVMQVLVALARRRGEVVSRDELIEACWEGRVVGDDALHRCTYKIRKLGEAHTAFRLETIPRVGYRLWVEEAAQPSPAVPAAEAPIPADSIPAPEEAGSPPSPNMDGLPPPRPRRIPIPPWALFAGLAAAAVAISLFFLVRPPAPAAPPPQRVAFFGFAATDEDSALQDIAARATDEAFVNLGIRRIDTIARAEAVAPAGQSRLDRAAELGARYALSGEVRRDGDNAVFALRIESVESRATLWESTTEGPVAKPLRTAFEASDRAMEVTTCIVTGAYGDPAGPRNAEALALAASGCSTIWSVGLGRSIPIFREMIERNLGGPDAEAGLAYTLARVVALSPPAARPGMLAEAREMVSRASQKRPDSFATAAARANVSIAGGVSPAQWIPELEAAMQRTMPASETHWFHMANITLVQAMWASGRLKDAIAYAQSAQGGILRDTTSNRVQYLSLLAGTDSPSSGGRTWDQMIPETLRRRPDGFLWENGVAAMALSGKGDLEELLADPQLPAEPYVVTCYRDLAAAMRLTSAAARLAASKKAEACLTPFGSLHVVVEAASILGDLDAAFAALETPERVNQVAFIWYPSWFQPRAKALRADPRFLPLMERLGYVDYWRRTGTKPDACSTPEERGIPLCRALE
jgi:DNA-binding winged helix-turn-helix (wHTH) protein/TolB-like protein